MNLFLKNKNIILLGILILFIFAISIVAISAYKLEKRNKDISQVYYHAMQSINKNNKPQLIKIVQNKLKNIVLENPNLKISNLITISVAQLYFELQEYRNSIDTYKSLINKLNSRDMLMPLVLSGLKLNYEKLKFFNEINIVNKQLKKLNML